jgi:hypothetical protein
VPGERCEVMAFRARDYAPNWKEVSLHIRQVRAGSRCECTGECGLHHDRRCEEMDGEPAKWANGKVMLTVAHLDHAEGPCRCKEETGIKCANPDHLKACCQRCHLRIDTPHHVANAARTRRMKHERNNPVLLEVEADKR